MERTRSRHMRIGHRDRRRKAHAAKRSARSGWSKPQVCRPGEACCLNAANASFLSKNGRSGGGPTAGDDGADDVAARRPLRRPFGRMHDRRFGYQV